MELKIRCCHDCPARYVNSYDDSEYMCALIPTKKTDKHDYESRHVLHNTCTTIDDSCPLIKENVTLTLDRTACLCGEDNGTGAVLPHKTWCPKA